MVLLGKGWRADALPPVVESFSALSGARKAALIDSLMSGSRHAFDKMAELLWPGLSKKECRVLEKYILRQMAANDR